MIPGRAARLDLQPVDRRAAGLEHGERIGLGVEHVDTCRALPDQLRPEPSSLAVPRRTPAATRRWPSGVSLS